MKTIIWHAVAVGVLALGVGAGNAVAQTAGSPVLNTVELRKLVTSTDPADNARLSAHFTALSERYAAEAKRHGAIAQGVVGTRTQAASIAAADQYRRLAQLNAEAAEALRELAGHHEKLAAGVASRAPRQGAAFQRGAGAPEPTDAELRALAEKARTPSEHRSLAEYFSRLASRYDQDAADHAAMAQSYRCTRISTSDSNKE